MGEPYEIMLPNNRLENLRRTWPLGAIPPYDLMSVGSWSGVPGASTRGTLETTGSRCNGSLGGGPCMTARGGARKVPLSSQILRENFENFSIPRPRAAGIVVFVGAVLALLLLGLEK
tara:strand:+ start:601 stop:951 length:351 start_codon:yes stop_codon:yes gene_type:complete